MSDQYASFLSPAFGKRHPEDGLGLPAAEQNGRIDGVRAPVQQIAAAVALLGLPVVARGKAAFGAPDEEDVADGLAVLHVSAVRAARGVFDCGRVWPEAFAVLCHGLDLADPSCGSLCRVFL